MTSNYSFFKTQSILWSMVIIAHMPLPFHIIYIFPNITLLYVIQMMITYNRWEFLLLSAIAGAFDDIASGNIIGVTSMEFAIVGCYFHYIKTSTKESFSSVWKLTSTLIFICYIAKNLINYIFISDHIFNYQDFIVYIISILFYPVSTLIFNYLLCSREVKDAR